jgi:hypothetical protein
VILDGASADRSAICHSGVRDGSAAKSRVAGSCSTLDAKAFKLSVIPNWQTPVTLIFSLTSFTVARCYIRNHRLNQPPLASQKVL